MYHTAKDEFNREVNKNALNRISDAEETAMKCLLATAEGASCNTTDSMRNLYSILPYRVEMPTTNAKR